MKYKKEIIRLTFSALLVAISIVSLYFIRFPLIPSAPFLEYDIADIPVMFGAMLFGPVSGLIILLCTCLIQALTVSASSGIIGFIMHFVASSVFVIIPSVIYKKYKTTKSLAVGLILGSIGMTVVMIPLNIVFTGLFMGTGINAVLQMLVPAIIPFNILKAIINSIVTFILFGSLEKIIKTDF